jgi:aspartate/methionine/tyrosine aminotransferase
VDEIYALSSYNENRKFISISAVLADLGEDFGDYIHVVWSFSKDFSMSGFRVWIIPFADSFY